MRKQHVLGVALVWVTMFVVAARLSGETSYVAQNGQTPVPPFSGWSTAASNIQDAVSLADAGDTVWVGQGLYRKPSNAVVMGGTNVVFMDKPIVLRSAAGAAQTVLDGEGLHRGVMVYHDAVGEGLEFVIDGFTIRNGFALATNNLAAGTVAGSGGGVLFQAAGSASPRWSGRIVNCVVTGCCVMSRSSSVVACGGGVAAHWDQGGAFMQVLVSNSVVQACRATNTVTKANSRGGGLYFHTGSYSVAADQILVNSRVEGNSAASGGGIYAERSGLSVFRSVICGNVAQHYSNASSGGGGIHAAADVSVVNSLLYENEALETGYGGAIASVSQGSTKTVLVESSTLVHNTASRLLGGGALYIRAWPSGTGHPTLALYNTIMFFNKRDGQAWDSDIQATAPVGKTNYAYHSCVASHPDGSVIFGGGTGNVAGPPIFMDVEGRDYRLSGKSSLINAGTNRSWMAEAVDLDGNRRIDGLHKVVDLGCYEYPFAGSMLMIR